LSKLIASPITPPFCIRPSLLEDPLCSVENVLGMLRACPSSYGTNGGVGRFLITLLASAAWLRSAADSWRGDRAPVDDRVGCSPLVLLEQDLAGQCLRARRDRTGSRPFGVIR